MKYEYLKQIDEALTKIICSEAGLHYNLKSKGVDNGKRGDFDELSHDVEEAFSILESGKWPFRCDNSDRFVSGAPIPPEISLIGGEMFACRRICEAIADESSDIGFRARWGNYGARFLEWSMLIRQYYPPVVPASKKGNKRAAGRPDRPIEYYMLTDDKEGYKDTLRKNMDVLKRIGGGECSAKDVGGFIGVEIEKGRLRNDVSVAEFCRVFNLKCSPQSVGKYIPEALRPKRNKRQS